MFFFELSLVPILLMVLYWGSQPERLSAGLYFLFYTATFSVPYLILVLVSFPKVFFLFPGLELTRFILSVLIVSPFLVKMPVLGLHF